MKTRQRTVYDELANNYIEIKINTWSETANEQPHLFVVLLQFMVNVEEKKLAPLIYTTHTLTHCSLSGGIRLRILDNIKNIFIEKCDQNHVCAMNEMNESGQTYWPNSRRILDMLQRILRRFLRMPAFKSMYKHINDSQSSSTDWKKCTRVKPRFHV